MGIQHEKYELPVLSQIITQTFGDFRSRARPGDNLLALFALSAAPTAAFWWLSQPTVPRSNGPFGIFRPCNRPGGACQEACVSPFPPIGTFRSFASPACRTSAGSAPGPNPSGGNPRPRNGTARELRGRAASFWHFRPLGRPGGGLLAAFRNHRPRQRQPSWRFSHPLSPPQQTFGDFRPCNSPGGSFLAAFTTIIPRDSNPFGDSCNYQPSQRHPFWRFFVPAPGGPLAAALWHLSSSQPLLQTAVCTSDRGSCTKKEAAWGRRRPLGRGMCALKGTCAWGALC